ncbi:BPSS1780 family membrane protein [Rugamonas sp. CCM 8940]|uniref:BPSS1780 family membrane protein n=1 Tax=Rugamonas sp. CCM 8940 TaxID=2765359 RepID=UPI0018F511BC|nr:BPSS1780 family membrane protein [Rugamonas sp. CCM 8940]MBJ7314140.1 hypothetical protein [Rugamonas sp. CCM 8940]
MEKLPANTGWHWVKQGFALFRQQPGGLSTLFLGYMLIMLLIGSVPLLGQLLPVILVPVFSIAFMQACNDIEQGKRISPKRLLIGFRKPVFAVLFTLGLLYLAMAALALGVSALADDGVFFKLLTGQIEPAAAKNANLGGAMLLALLIYIPGAMAFCFAAPLIYWQNMSLGKAIFFSFFAVLRALKAFVVFILGWFGISVVLSQVVILVFGARESAMMVMLPISVILTVMLHCSFYASYRQIFGAPQPEAAPAPLPIDEE